MKRTALLAGIVLMLVGCYYFAVSMIMITSYTFDFDWTIWTLYLTIGIVLISVGPGIIAYAFAGNYSSRYEQVKWQMIQLPISCPECDHPIEIHSLEWIGPEEARCPFCSNQIDVRRTM
ncbi:MAG: hypothetical protein JW779_06300 [Candidatus Thorarchaeota archaeon]|nr:hypothetical protein [Candidatus Thorarchaeota archaeon]